MVIVVTDADLVPRMSGASLVHAFRDIASYDWTAKGAQDRNIVLSWLQLRDKEGILKWTDDLIGKLLGRPFFLD